MFATNYFIYEKKPRYGAFESSDLSSDLNPSVDDTQSVSGTTRVVNNPLALKLTPNEHGNDYFVFKDKAAPLGVKWGNDWMQQQPKLHQQFLAEYAQGKNYVWKDFRVRYCDLD